MTTTPNPVNTRNVPPPPTPLVDLQTGYPTKPWWRWFSWINTVITIVVSGELQLLTPADLSGEVADLQKRIDNLEVLTQTPRTDNHAADLPAIPNLDDIDDDLPPAPYVPPLGTNSNFGVVRGDGTTIDIDNGVVSAIGGGGTAYMPKTDGSQPPNLADDGAGSLIAVPYS